MAEKRPIITLTTDFGEADYYVPAVKGVIRQLNPSAEIIDITHLIPPQDIYAAAYTLRCCYAEFPKQTLHLVIVDPGVGSRRRPILVMAGDYLFVGPDNGVFSYIYQNEEVARVVHLSSEHYFRQPVSHTFHGRDVFAPCAAALSRGVEWRMLGEEISDYAKLSVPRPVVTGRSVKGVVIHIDRFGNVVTNITSSELTQEMIQGGVTIKIGNQVAHRILTHFAEAAQNELFAYFGSAGFLELAISRQPAARHLDARRGLEVEVVPGQ